MTDAKVKERGTQRLNAYEQFLVVIAFYQKLASFFGFDLYRDDYQFNWKIKFSFIWTLVFLMKSVYLAVHNFLIGDGEEFLKTICFFACVAQVCILIRKMVEIKHNTSFLCIATMQNVKHRSRHRRNQTMSSTCSSINQVERRPT